MEIDMNIIIELRLSSWIGVSIGAEHYYAELVDTERDKQVDLFYKLSTRQATKINKKVGYSGLYRKGSEYNGFFSREDAIEFAVKHWLEHFPDGDFLVLGRSGGGVEPKLVLDSRLKDDSGIKQKSQEIYDKCESIGWYDDPENDEKMDRYYDDWAKLVGARRYG